MAEKTTSEKSLLAKGGGDATAGGVSIQASIAASFAARLLAGIGLDKRFGLGAAKAIAIRCEAETPVDDVVVETDAGGWIFIQSKNTLTASFSLKTSELGKTFDEIARLWLLTCRGAGSGGWDRPLIYGKDAIVIAVGYATYATVKVGLARVLNSVRSKSTATLNQTESLHLTSLRALLRSAFDEHGAAADLDIDSVLKFVHIVDYDFRGNDRELAEQWISPLLELPSEASIAFKAIEHHCQSAMVNRARLDGVTLRQALAADGMMLKTAARGGLAEFIENGQAVLSKVSALAGSRAESPIVTQVAKQRLMAMRQSRFLVGTDSAAQCNALLAAIETGDLSAASNEVRQSIFAWCARVLASTDHEKAQEALAQARKLGVSDETAIASALVNAFAEGGDKADALADLATLDTPDSRSASLIIVSHDIPPAEGLLWLQATGLAASEFHPDGKFRILGLYLQTKDADSALQLAETLNETDYEATPALLFFAGHVHLNQAVHPDLHEALLMPLPPDLAHFPLADDAQAMAHRAKAVEFYQRASVALHAMGATQASTICDDRALWLQLRDPASAQQAVERLKSSMADDKARLRRVPFAFAFKLDVNLEALELDIDRATALSGGKSQEAAIARFEVALHRRAPEVADYIDRHRKQLLTYYDYEFLTAIEIEALCKAGRVGPARAKLDALASTVSTESLANLRNLVERAAGSDVVEMMETEYRRHPTVPKLITLISELRGTRDFRKLAEFSEKLFRQVRDVSSAETYTEALYKIQSDDQIAELADRYPEIVEASANVGSTVAWALYRLGRLEDAGSRLETLKSGRDDQNDRLLATSIAVASGDWSALGIFVESEWQNRNGRTPMELLRAGVLAQRIGSNARSQELVRAAAGKADGDAVILVNAYSIASSAGWENDEDIHLWLNSAIAASGEDGPIRQVNVRELLDAQPEWNDRMDRTWDHVVRGDAPLFAAARAANRTLLDLFLRPAMANLELADLRRKSPIFAFSGAKPIQDNLGKRVAVDITSLLTLSLTGQLRRFLDWADSATIAHTTLGWLFEERDKLAFHQPSQVRRARAVKQLIDSGRLHRFESAAVPHEIEMRVGGDIARYLVAAKTIDDQTPSQKMVVRPAPLPKPGSLLEESADISGFEDCFAGVGDVLAALRLAGQLSEAESSNAEAYLRVHEEPWPHTPVVQPGATLYLDDVALSYLQHLGLLARLPMAGFTVYVTSSEVERADVLVGYDASADDARRLVEDIQLALRDAIASGKAKLGRLIQDEEGGDIDTHPSRMLLLDRPEVDVLIIDDRFVNRISVHGTYPIANSVELLAAMTKEGHLEAEKLTDAITVIRRAGMLFTPLIDGEMLALLNSAPVDGGRLRETAELRALRESVLLARMTDGLQLPEEGRWIDHLFRETVTALRGQWQASVTDEIARVRSNWLLQFLDTRGWSHRSIDADINLVERRKAQLLALLILPTSNETVRERYRVWLEEAMLTPFREEQPDAYTDMMHSIRQIIDERVSMAISENAFG